MASTVKEVTERVGLPSRTVPLAAAALALNAAWEVAHWPLYECPWSPPALAGAAAVDAAITLGAAEIASCAPHGRTATAVFLGALGSAALIIELGALQRGRRFYAPAMPTVGGVGITPWPGSGGCDLAARLAAQAEVEREGEQSERVDAEDRLRRSV